MVGNPNPLASLLHHDVRPAIPNTGLLAIFVAGKGVMVVMDDGDIAHDTDGERINPPLDQVTICPRKGNGACVLEVGQFMQPGTPSTPQDVRKQTCTGER